MFGGSGSRHSIATKAIERNAGSVMGAGAPAETGEDGTPVPALYVCPLTRTVMTDPVVAKCGHMFDRDAIDLYWLRKQHACPLCSSPISDPSVLIECIPVKQAIEAFLQAHGKLSSAANSRPDLGAMYSHETLRQGKGAGVAQNNSTSSLNKGLFKLSIPQSLLSRHANKSHDSVNTARDAASVQDAGAQPGNSNSNAYNLEDTGTVRTGRTAATAATGATARKTIVTVAHTDRKNQLANISNHQIGPANGVNNGGGRAEGPQAAAWARLVPLFVSQWSEIDMVGEYFVMGRSHACEYLYSIPEVSARHCQFHRRGPNFYLEDLSTNGTFQNGKKIGKGRIVPLSQGDVISLGSGFNVDGLPELETFLEKVIELESLTSAECIELRGLDRATPVLKLLQAREEAELKRFGITKDNICRALYSVITKWRNVNKLPIYTFDTLQPPASAQEPPTPAPARLVAPALTAIRGGAQAPAAVNEDSVLSLMVDLFPQIDPAQIRKTIREALADEPVDWTDAMDVRTLQDNVALQLAVLTECNPATFGSAIDTVGPSVMLGKVPQNTQLQPLAVQPAASSQLPRSGGSSPTARRMLPVPQSMGTLAREDFAGDGHSSAVQDGSPDATLKPSSVRDAKKGGAETVLRSDVSNLAAGMLLERARRPDSGLKAAETPGLTLCRTPLINALLRSLTQSIVEGLDRAKLPVLGAADREPYYAKADVVSFCINAVSQLMQTLPKEPFDDAKTVKYVASSAEQKNATRPKEDRLVIIDDYNALNPDYSGQAQSFYAIFDGHGGEAASSYAATHLPYNIIADGRKLAEDAAAAFKQAYERTDAGVIAAMTRDGQKGGSTALTLLLREDECLLSWVGHTRAVLYQSRGEGQGGIIGVTLTEPHYPVGNELARIERDGGFVSMVGGKDRVQGRLVISRSFGNASIKQFVPAVPECLRFNLNKSERFLVMATESYWELVSIEETGAILAEYERKGNALDASASELLAACTKRKFSVDDITVLVINFVENLAA